jgi:recombination DNA repair RAD52 pathway protein
MSGLTTEQVDTLLKPINPLRVLDLNGKAYLAQHDVRAHMNRVFGFANWATDVLHTALVFEEQDRNGRWIACYTATVKVSVYDNVGGLLAHYTDCHASGNAPQPARAEAHALALTSAVSTAFKRACTNLGDQFGLSLYNKGQRTAFVRGTLVHPSKPAFTTPEPEHVAAEEEQP